MSRYTAFISYRHLTPDEEVAKKLHTMIETFGVPAPLKRSLEIKNMGRVFRDQEELPLSSSLGDDIHQALDNSDWLICICSPRYLTSRWCMEELRYFLSLGRADRVLTVLVEGEPDEAFPEAIRYQMVDGVRVEKEPLAADVRANSLEEILKKLKSEKLRILAPMLGVSYDDLRKRARRRKNRIIASITAAAFLLLSGFLGYAIAKNNEIAKKNEEITAERNEALIAESKWLTKSANEALAAGDRMLALQLCLEALPTDFENPERPVTEEALETLRSAIISGTGDSLYHSVTTISIPGLEQVRGLENTVACFSRDIDGYIAAYDLATGKEKEYPHQPVEMPVCAFFDAGLNDYCVYRDHIEYLGNDISNVKTGKDENGNWILEEAKGEYKAFDQLVDGMDRYGCFLLLQDSGVFGGDRYIDFKEENAGIYEGFMILDAKPVKFSSKYNYCYVIGGYYSKTEADEAPAMVIINAANAPPYKGNSEVLFRYYMDGDLVQKTGAWNWTTKSYSFENIDVSWDSSIIAGYDDYGLYFWRVDEPRMAASFDMNLLGAEHTTIRKAAFCGTGRGMIAILGSDSCIYLYDCVKEEMVRKLAPGLYQVTDFQWNADGTKLLLTCGEEAARVISVADGTVLQRLPCDFLLQKAEYGARDFDDNSRDDTYILLSGRDELQIWQLNSQDHETAITRRINDQNFSGKTYDGLDPYLYHIGPPISRVALSEDGKDLWIENDGLYHYDVVTCERKHTLYEGTHYLRISTMGERLYVFKKTDSHGIIRVVDIHTGEEIGFLQPTYPHLRMYKYPYSDEPVRETVRDEKLCIGNVTFREDGSLLLVSMSNGNSSFQADPFVAVYRTDTLEKTWQIGYDGGNASSRDFPFEIDWEKTEGGFDLYGHFISNTDLVLCQYVFSTDYIYGKETLNAGGTPYRKEGSWQGLEVRDAHTGEVKTSYTLPQAVMVHAVDADHGVFLVQYADFSIHLYEAATGNEMARTSGEADSEIYQFWTDENGFCLHLHLPGAEKKWTIGKCYHIGFDGTVQEMTAQTLQKPDEVWTNLYPGSPYAVFESRMIRKDTGKTVLETMGGDLVLYRSVTPAELRNAALAILDGKKLTEEQKGKYYLH